MSVRRGLSLTGLVLLMGGSGILHLAKPQIYTPAVPRFLGSAEFLVFWSGLLEIAAGLLLVIPRTRRLGAMLTVAILVGVFPANVKMALDGAQAGGGWYAGSPLMLWLRLPLQPLLVYWAWTFVRKPAAGTHAGPPEYETAAGS